MKKFASLLIALMLVAPGVSVAADAAADAGITPSSRWYFFDILVEDIWQNVLGVFDWRAQGRYMRERMDEREDESFAETREKGWRADEVKKALGSREDLKRELIEHMRRNLKREAAVERDEQMMRGVHEDPFRKEYVDAQEKDRLEARKQELREKIVDSRKSSDKERTAALLRELDGIIDNDTAYDLMAMELDRSARAAAERFEQTYPSKEKLELIIKRATAEIDELEAKRAAALEAEMNKAKEAAGKEGPPADLEAAAKELQKTLVMTEKALREQARKQEAELTLPEERGEEPAAEPDPTAPVPAPTRPKTAPKPAPLKPIPSESVQTAPLQLLYYPTLTGQVGVPFSAQYGASNGLPPYHYKLDTGVGFPPHGLILDTNGRLSGTPSIEGKSTFGVCVVDTAGNSVCANTVMTVAAAAPPPPPPEPAPEPETETPLTLAITSRSCLPTEYEGRYVVELTGTASGPPWSRVQLVGASSKTCGAWYNSNIGCQRDGVTVPETVQWTMRIQSSWEPETNTVVAFSGSDNQSIERTFEMFCP